MNKTKPTINSKTSKTQTINSNNNKTNINKVKTQ